MASEHKAKRQKIVPCLWFDGKAEEASSFYHAVFPESRIGEISRYPDVGQDIHRQQAGSVMTVRFWLWGCEFLALNGGPDFRFNSSVSFFVLCDREEEVTRIWKELISGGNALMPLDRYEWSPKYGWLEDRYGVNWQIMLQEDIGDEARIIPLLFFTGGVAGKAREAIEHYLGIFERASITEILTYNEGEAEYRDRIKHARIVLEGQDLMLMDANMDLHDAPFNEALSLMVMCRDQAEIDHYWDRLSEGGDVGAQQCGWLKDKFGVSWQIVPEGMEEFLNSEDPARARKGFEAMLGMKKIDLQTFKNIV